MLPTIPITICVKFEDHMFALQQEQIGLGIIDQDQDEDQDQDQDQDKDLDPDLDLDQDKDLDLDQEEDKDLDRSLFSKKLLTLRIICFYSNTKTKTSHPKT